jgi:heme-degrading monooxygenase HmoA
MNRRLSFALGVVALAVAGAAGVVIGAPSDATPTPKHMIARIWRGRTLAAKADEYERYLNNSGIEKIRATAGNLGVTVLRRTEGEKTEFLVMSVWESIDAIKRFAGEDYEKTVVLPRDREYLLEVEPNVLHYEIKREERKP